jgi:hypothetical protein
LNEYNSTTHQPLSFLSMECHDGSTFTAAVAALYMQGDAVSRLPHLSSFYSPTASLSAHHHDDLAFSSSWKTRSNTLQVYAFFRSKEEQDYALLPTSQCSLVFASESSSLYLSNGKGFPVNSTVIALPPLHSSVVVEYDIHSLDGDAIACDDIQEEMDHEEDWYINSLSSMRDKEKEMIMLEGESILQAGGLFLPAGCTPESHSNLLCVHIVCICAGGILKIILTPVMKVVMAPVIAVVRAFFWFRFYIRKTALLIS